MTYYAAIALTTSMATLFLGTFTFSRISNNKTNISFLLFCISISIWSFLLYLNASAQSAKQALLWIKLLHSVSIFIPIFFLQFTYYLTGLFQRRRTLIGFLYFIAGTFVVLMNSSYFLDARYKEAFGFFVCQPKPMYALYIAVFIGIVSFTYIELFLAQQKREGIQRLQIQYLTLATIVGWSGGTTNFLINYDLNIPVLFPFGNLTILLYVVLVSFVIVKYKLLEIALVIKKSFVFTLLVSFVMGVYSLAIFLASSFYRGYGINQLFATLITSLAIVFGYKPLEDLITSLTDRYFFKKRYE